MPSKTYTVYPNSLLLCDRSLTVNLAFSHIGFWSWNFFLISTLLWIIAYKYLFTILTKPAVILWHKIIRKIYQTNIHDSNLRIYYHTVCKGTKLNNDNIHSEEIITFSLKIIINRKLQQRTYNVSKEIKPKGNITCTMDDVRGDFFWPPHGTAPASLACNALREHIHYMHCYSDLRGKYFPKGKNMSVKCKPT